MEDLEKIVSELSITTYKKGSVHWVDVTFITDPHNFYVRPTKYDPFLSRLDATCTTVKVESVNDQDLVIFNWGYSRGFSQYFRGRIIKVETDVGPIKCDIFAIDYGFIEKAVPIQNIWKCDEIVSRLPSLAALCQLSNCYPIQHTSQYRGFTADTINAFRSYVENEPSRMTVLGKQGSKLIVVLINSNPDDIATLMAIGAFSEIGHYKDPIKWKPTTLRRVNVRCKDLELDEMRLHVRMLSGKSLKEFYVASIIDYNNHLKEAEFITFYAKREFKMCHQDIAVGVPVCVKDEDSDIYERGFVKSLNMQDKIATVKLIDWGRDEEYSFDKLKYMSAMCLRTTALAIFCLAADNQFWKTDMEKFLTPGYEFLITVKNLGSDFDVPNTVDIFPLDDCYVRAAGLSDET